jgi:F1F0 ATPase subunit 2
MMREILYAAAAYAAGSAIGMVYFGGLWITVKRMPAAAKPAVLFIASFLLRTAVLAASLILIAVLAEWYHVLFALGGIMTIKILLTAKSKNGGLKTTMRNIGVDAG